MTENKRFYIGNGENCTICDSSKGGSDFFNMLTQYEAVDKLNELFDENEQLKAQLYCDSNEGVCSICKHHYLEKGNIFYISKCEKGHEKCSKESVRHCEDFKLKELQE